MQKFLCRLIVVTCALFLGTAYACDSDQIDVTGDGTNCINTKFSITTTNLSAGTQFKFFMSATGTFYVDCGTDGTLSSAADPTDVSGNTITRTDTTETLYTCTYDTAGVKTIQFAGTATGYSTVASGSNLNNFTEIVPTVRFGYTDATPTLVAEISGSLGLVFPTLGQSNGQQPRFFSTFRDCTNLILIPSSLFSGVYGGASYMFYYTFGHCSKITSIPENLFQNINQCGYKLFADTFRDCGKLTSIPEKLFDSIHCHAGDLFIRTFRDCDSLTTIPENLFKNISLAAGYMFCQTFMDCNSLTSLPYGLFANIRSCEADAFLSTFERCTNLSGYIPPSFFAGLIANNATYQKGMMTYIFSDTNLDTSCPSGTVRYTTPYDSYWSSKVSCVDEYLTCDSGEYLRAHGYQCTTCPTGYTCGGGTYPYSENADQGITANNISIVYQDENGNAIDSGTCSYGEAISLPTTPTKTGYTFAGWQVVSN